MKHDVPKFKKRCLKQIRHINVRVPWVYVKFHGQKGKLCGMCRKINKFGIFIHDTWQADARRGHAY
jgi:hypothetical protein